MLGIKSSLSFRDSGIFWLITKIWLVGTRGGRVILLVVLTRKKSFALVGSQGFTGRASDRINKLDPLNWLFLFIQLSETKLYFSPCSDHSS